MSILPNQIDKYRLIKRLGGGSFGEVYLAHDLALSANTAIKIIKIDDKTKIPTLIQEAQIMDKCRHKHIVEIREANIFPIGSENYLIFGLEYLPEGSLENEMSTRWITIKEACTRISHVLSGLQDAHSKGFLHRDIKPGNILIDGDSTKLSDFGLASMCTLCTSGMMSYHPHCPPEHYLSHSPTILFDIYAMGITLFRIVNNYSNWRNQLSNISNINKVIEKGQLIKILGFQKYIPQKVRRIINVACNFDPTKRYQSALLFKNNLDSMRFEIDWSMSSIGNWNGNRNSEIHTLSTSVKKNMFYVDYFKNNRRVKEYCNIFSSFEKANNNIQAIIVKTSLK